MPLRDPPNQRFWLDRPDYCSYGFCVNVKHWQLQEAKNRFSEVVAQAIKHGAQTVTKHGKPAVIIVSVEEYQRHGTPRKTLFQALRECPEDLSSVVGKRLKGLPRSIQFE